MRTQKNFIALILLPKFCYPLMTPPLQSSTPSGHACSAAPVLPGRRARMGAHAPVDADEGVA